LAATFAGTSGVFAQGDALAVANRLNGPQRGNVWT